MEFVMRANSLKQECMFSIRDLVQVYREEDEDKLDELERKFRENVLNIHSHFAANYTPKGRRFEGNIHSLELSRVEVYLKSGCRIVWEDDVAWMEYQNESYPVWISVETTPEFTEAFKKFLSI
jgi:hypothetical protein